MSIINFSGRLKNFPISLKMAILANILYYGLLIPAGILYPGYNILNDATSSLGGVTLNPNGWYLFSIALILIGITFIPYYIGLNKWINTSNVQKWKIRVVQVLGFLDAIFMALIAVFPTDISHPPHLLFSFLNLQFISLTILFLVIFLWKHPKFNRRIGIYGIIVVLVLFTYGTLAATIYDSALLEHICFVISLLFSLLIGINMLKLD